MQKGTDVSLSRDYALDEVAAMLILVALSLLVLGIITVLRKTATGGRRDLGWVSEHWLAEYRADESSPSSR